MVEMVEIEWGLFVENADGVHVTHGEFTLCGDAFDMPDTEIAEAHLAFSRTSARTITCPRCIDIIKLCRGVRFKEPPHA